MAERLKAHAWKVCKPKGFVGSNPILSANEQAPIKGLFYWLGGWVRIRVGSKKSSGMIFHEPRILRRARRVRYMDVPDNPFLSANEQAPC